MLILSNKIILALSGSPQELAPMIISNLVTSVGSGLPTWTVRFQPAELKSQKFALSAGMRKEFARGEYFIR